MEAQQIPPSSQLDNFFSIAFDESTRRNIRTAAQWARIVAICGFVSAAISIVVAFFGRMTVEYNGFTSTPSRASSIVSALFGTVISVMINYFLYRFADVTMKGMDSMDSIKANEGFNNFRIYWKVIGILIIIGLSLLVLALLFVLIGRGLSR